MYLHDCQGAECPHCGPWSLGRTTQPGLHSTWYDSTGASVRTYPKRLSVGTTVIIMIGSMENRQVLCQQRRDNQWWGFPGGSQNIGESITTCALREVKEETGLDVILRGVTSIDSNPALYGLCTYADGIVHYTNITFLANIAREHWQDATNDVYHLPAVTPCAESLELVWCPIHRMPEPFLLNHRWRLEQALAHRGPFLPVR